MASPPLNFLLRTVLVLLAGTVLLSAPAIFNGFPLIFSDTGAYLTTAFDGSLPLGRPVGYGLFLRYTGVGLWVWLPVLVQGFLLTGLMLRTAIVVLGKHPTLPASALTLSLLALFTGIGWYSGQLMPDIFVAGLVLAIFLLLYDRKLHIAGKLMLVVLVYWFTFSHYSHVSLSLALLFTLGLLLFFQRRRRPESEVPRPILLLWPLVPTLMALLTFCLVNYNNGNGFKMTRSSHVFMMGRLVACGILEEYLDEACAESEYKLCAYKDRLPHSAGAFIWGGKSPFRKTGYWKSSEAEYNAIIGDIFSRPKYLIRFAWEGLEAGLKQVFHLRIGEGLTPYRKNKAPYKAFEKWMPEVLPAYTGSWQSEKRHDFELLNILHFALFAAAFVLLYLLIGWRREWLPPNLLGFVWVVAFGFLLNALITGALGNVYDRLQARVAWLVIFAALLAFRMVQERSLRADSAASAVDSSP